MPDPLRLLSSPDGELPAAPCRPNRCTGGAGLTSPPPPLRAPADLAPLRAPADPAPWPLRAPADLAPPPLRAPANLAPRPFRALPAARAARYAPAANRTEAWISRSPAIQRSAPSRSHSFS